VHNDKQIRGFTITINTWNIHTDSLYQTFK